MSTCHCRINIDDRLYNKSTVQYCISIVVPDKTKTGDRELVMVIEIFHGKILSLGVILRKTKNDRSSWLAIS